MNKIKKHDNGNYYEKIVTYSGSKIELFFPFIFCSFMLFVIYMIAIAVFTTALDNPTYFGVIDLLVPGISLGIMFSLWCWVVYSICPKKREVVYKKLGRSY